MTTTCHWICLREQYDNSFHALEYYIADNALSRIAAALGKKEDARLFHERSLGYKHYYCKEYGTFRPILPNGEFYASLSGPEGERTLSRTPDFTKVVPGTILSMFPTM